MLTYLRMCIVYSATIVLVALMVIEVEADGTLQEKVLKAEAVPDTRVA